MGKIVAIGGGSIARKVTLPIDKEIIKLSGKKKPHVLFIPTASGDSKEYWQIFQEIYKDHLGTTTDALFLIKNAPTPGETEDMIKKADIIYVGGGNTLRMMKIWRKRGVDKLLIDAYNKNKVMCGVSAGAICWFAYGNSDSRRYSNPKDWSPIRVKGLGILASTVCPHYHKEKREKGFDVMIKKHHIEKSFAVDDGAALSFVNDKFEVLRATPHAKAYLLLHKKGEIEKKSL